MPLSLLLYKIMVSICNLFRFFFFCRSMDQLNLELYAQCISHSTAAKTIFFFGWGPMQNLTPPKNFEYPGCNLKM